MNDSSTYCQYFKLKVPNLTLNGFHLDFFLIDHIDKLHYCVITQPQSSEIMKSAFLQVHFAELTLSSANKPLQQYPSVAPQSPAQMQDTSQILPQMPQHFVCPFCKRFHCIWWLTTVFLNYPCLWFLIWKLPVSEGDGKFLGSEKKYSWKKIFSGDLRICHQNYRKSHSCPRSAFIYPE